MLLALDIGSSSIKCALLRGTRIGGRMRTVEFDTARSAERAEIRPAKLLDAIVRAIAQTGPLARKADALALSVMSPAWVAMDKRGRALTPIVTHQDRRSVRQALNLEMRVGKRRHLHLAGNRPFPGGISSTTFAWFAEHHPELIRRTDLAGHLNTFLHRQWTDQRVIDPSNASFTGLYRTLTLGGWCDELMAAVGATRSQLPDILPADRIAGYLHPTAAGELGLRAGLPVLSGIVDGGAGMLLCGAHVGQLYHVCGSTDVLALCTDRPVPHERLLIRALGVGRRWVAVSTLAAAGSALDWIKHQLFADLDWKTFGRLMMRLGRDRARTEVRCTPWFAGDRMAIEQPAASFAQLSLATTRQDLLRSLLEALIAASDERLAVLRRQPVRIKTSVMASATRSGLGRVLRRNWPGQWTVHTMDDATLRGLGKLWN